MYNSSSVCGSPKLMCIWPSTSPGMTVAPSTPTAGIVSSRTLAGQIVRRPDPGDQFTVDHHGAVGDRRLVDAGKQSGILDATQSAAGTVHRCSYPIGLSERDEWEVLAPYGLSGGQPHLCVTVVVLVPLRSQPDGPVSHETDYEGPSRMVGLVRSRRCHTSDE